MLGDQGVQSVHVLAGDADVELLVLVVQMVRVLLQIDGFVLVLADQQLRFGDLSRDRFDLLLQRVHLALVLLLFRFEALELFFLHLQLGLLDRVALGQLLVLLPQRNRLMLHLVQPFTGLHLLVLQLLDHLQHGLDLVFNTFDFALLQF